MSAITSAAAAALACIAASLWLSVLAAICAAGLVLVTGRWLWDCFTHFLFCIYLALSEDVPWGYR